MIRGLFVNLPVADLGRSVDFFEALGFSFDPAFTGDNGACLLVSAQNRVMLVAEPFFRTLTRKTPTDTRVHTEVLLSLHCDTRAQVDALVAKALAAGGTVPGPPEDHGFMYEYGFEDPDGHQWGVFWMNTSAPDGPGSQGGAADDSASNDSAFNDSTSNDSALPSQDR